MNPADDASRDPLDAAARDLHDALSEPDHRLHVGGRRFEIAEIASEDLEVQTEVLEEWGVTFWGDVWVEAAPLTPVRVGFVETHTLALIVEPPGRGTYAEFTTFLDPPNPAALTTNGRPGPRHRRPFGYPLLQRPDLDSADLLDLHLGHLQRFLVDQTPLLDLSRDPLAPLRAVARYLDALGV